MATTNKDFRVKNGLVVEQDVTVGGDITITGTITGDGSGLIGVSSYTSTDFANDLATKSTSDLTEGTNLYYTDTRVGTYLTTNSYATESFVTSAVAGKDNTDEITEGTTNLYFTNARAQAAISAGTGIDVTLGVISNTGVTSLNGDTGAKTLAAYHTGLWTVTATEETNNASSAVTHTFSELSGSVQHAVYLNRTLLRPTEYSASGTTLTIASGLGLQLGDEIEVVGSRFTA